MSKNLQNDRRYDSPPIAETYKVLTLSPFKRIIQQVDILKVSIMERTKKLDLLKKSLLILLGSVIYALGVALFLDPNAIASGGVTGIAIIINYVTSGVVGTGWIILIINVPLFIIGAIFFGKYFIISSLISTALSSGLIELFAHTVAPYMPAMQNSVIPPVVGGMLFGVGLGLIFRAGSSTGGTDIIVKLLRKKFRHLKTGIISMAIDVVIVAVSGFIYKDLELLILTVISIAVFTVGFDFALYGGNSAKLVQIITTEDKVKPICDGILKDLDSSATIINAKGAYSGSDKTVILCVVKNYVYPRLRDIIREYDDDAFTVVTSANEIYGEGYKDHNAEEL